MRSILLLLIVTLSFRVTADDSVTLRLAAAANFYPTLKKIASRYEQKSNNKIRIIRGSTGKLYAQIINGAPYDIFLSADSARVDKLVEQGYGINNKNNRWSIVYAIGQLVLWKPNIANVQKTKQQLLSGNFKKLAIANPKTAPYGKAAVETLKSLGIYDSIKNKLVYGENIAQVMQFVQTGAADIGLLAKSYINKDKVWNIESHMHQPIVQKATILKQTDNINAAQDFMDYMQSDDIIKIILNDGYKR